MWLCHFLDNCLKRPVTVAEDGDSLAVAAHGVDVHVGRADHEVLVHHGLVETHSVALVQRQLLEALNGVGIAVAQCEVAGGIFIKEGVIEQQLCVTDGAVVGTRAHSPR